MKKNIWHLTGCGKTMLILNWIVWIRTVWVNWTTWNRHVFENKSVYLHPNCVLLLNFIVSLFLLGIHFLRWGFLIWVLILLRTFVLILVYCLKWNGFCMLNWILWNRTDYLYKLDLALNNLQRMICHTTQPNNQRYFLKVEISEIIRSV